MAQCNTSQCASISNTIISTVDSNVTDECYDNGTIITVSCNRGFQNLVDKYDTICNGTTGKFEPEGTCKIDLLTLLVAISMAYLVTTVALLLTCSIIRKWKSRKNRFDVPLQDVNLISTITAASNAGNPTENSQLPPEPEARLLTYNCGRLNENGQLRLEPLPLSEEYLYTHSIQEPACKTHFEIMMSEPTRDHLSDRSTSSPNEQHLYETIQTSDQECRRSNLVSAYELFMSLC
ncbi:uncharacterized protein LOC110979552 [Acanthaster planci]|uniref:Uncharacterized protein LOC110979552 n=1 Tax=Acanthaster planci TaxID=133434 RepID=A0A8B7YFH1_ACAPL|nr:uncharacterized protein LOC110979552 [Acanthaster planci]